MPDHATTDADHVDVRSPRGAHAVAWICLVGGAIASVGGNVAHAYLRPVGAHADWSPSFVSVCAAIVWPLALLGAVEILTRTPWRPGAGWWLVRYFATSVVALVAGVVSYRHMAGLLARTEDWFSAHAGPLAIDGLMVVAALALLSMSTELRGSVRAPALSVPVATDGPDLRPDADALVADTEERPAEAQPAPDLVASADAPEPATATRSREVASPTREAPIMAQNGAQSAVDALASVDLAKAHALERYAAGDVVTEILSQWPASAGKPPSRRTFDNWTASRPDLRTRRAARPVNGFSGARG
jgi:hypothetical protein